VLRNRVVQVRSFGGPDALQVVDAPLPTARHGEVRVRVLASGLEYTDVLIRRHLYPQTMRHRPPFVMGYDVIGEIDQLGDGVSSFQLGDRVADMTVVGSNAAYCTLRADRLTRVPAGIDPAEAATLILSWTTTYQLLHRAARVKQGQRVLVQGAAGAVGQALLVLGSLAGLELWGTARGAHAALIRDLGAGPIDYQRARSRGSGCCQAVRVRDGIPAPTKCLRRRTGLAASLRSTSRRSGDAAPPPRNRWFVDSPLEGDGFELPVPRAMQAPFTTASSTRNSYQCSPDRGLAALAIAIGECARTLKMARPSARRHRLQPRRANR